MQDEVIRYRQLNDMTTAAQSISSTDVLEEFCQLVLDHGREKEDWEYRESEGLRRCKY